MRDRISSLLLLGSARVLGALPLSLRVVLGRFLGALFSLIPTKDREIAALQMDLFLKREGGRRHLVPMYMGIGQSIAECLNLAPMYVDFRRYVAVRDEGLVKSLLADDRGVLAIAAHLSNWDLLAGAVSGLGFTLSTAGKEASNPTFQKLLEGIRSGSNVQTIWRRDPGSSMRIFRNLKNGEMVATLLDQDIEATSLHAPFFGMSARSARGMIDIAQRSGARIAVILLVRKGMFRYEMRVSELPAESPAEEIVRLYNQILENTIREFPWQWMWVHKRWRTPENGKRMRSAEYIKFLKERIADAAR